jgi:6-phosphogluconolactonase
MQINRPLSRRDFVATTTLGAIGLWRGTLKFADSQLLYIGTYTEGGRRDGIHLVRMDPGSGALQRIAAVDAGSNPSFLAIHPNGRSLFAVNEVSELTNGKPAGSIRSFTIDADSGEITQISEEPSEGAAPCYVSTDRTGKVVLVANYVSGTVAMLAVDEDGFLTNASQVVQHAGTGKNPTRQEHAHAHCIIPHPSNKFALVADLGIDRVLVYKLDVDGGRLQHMEENDALMPPGTGPRHLAFHPTLPFVYLAGELNSTVSVLRCDPDTGKLAIVQSLAMLPAGYTGENYPADIPVAPNGRALYVSNRGHNSVAVFSIARTGRLTYEQGVPTGGDWPRNFSIDPTGRWLLVANQRSGSVIVFARDVETGRLTRTPQRLDLPSPVCLRFRAHAGVTT